MDALTRSIVLKGNPWLAEPARWGAEAARRLPVRYVARMAESLFLKAAGRPNKIILV